MLRACLLITFFLLGCTTAPLQPADVMAPLPDGQYARLIRKHTSGTDQYSGFYQTFQADMTILNSEVQAAVLKQRAHFLQWDQAEFQTERERQVQEASAYSRFFMRFYSPESDYIDFHKGKSIWKIYLEFGGSRFEGKARKLNEKFVELNTLYPYLDRFSTPYEVTFNVPMTNIENGSVKVVLTSSLGTAEFSFPTGK